MPYTNHGHWYGPGEPTQPGPRLVAKCGGPGICTPCRQDTAGTDLREQIFEAIDAWLNEPDSRATHDEMVAESTDAVMAVVQPELDLQNAAFEQAIKTTASDALEHRGCGLHLGGAIRRAEQAEATIARVRQMADAWEQRLPETILTATAVEALRTATERYALAQPDDQPKEGQ